MCCYEFIKYNKHNSSGTLTFSLSFARCSNGTPGRRIYSIANGSSTPWRGDFPVDNWYLQRQRAGTYCLREFNMVLAYISRLMYSNVIILGFLHSNVVSGNKLSRNQPRAYADYVLCMHQYGCNIALQCWAVLYKQSEGARRSTRCTSWDVEATGSSTTTLYRRIRRRNSDKM